MPPIVVESKSSRDALLEAAKKLFTERGYDAVSTRELAEAAGVNLGAIQYHFGSKAKLFVETIYQLMEGTGTCHTKLQSVLEINSPTEAAQSLAIFIFSFLDYLLHCEGPQPCRMMFREIFSHTSEDKELHEALVSSVVRDFIKPVDDRLIETITHLLPAASREEIALHCHSIIGQCAFYLTHGPFAERLCGFSHAASPHFEETAAHIARFSLAALGCNQETITVALKHAEQNLRTAKSS